MPPLTRRPGLRASRAARRVGALALLVGLLSAPAAAQPAASPSEVVVDLATLTGRDTLEVLGPNGALRLRVPLPPGNAPAPAEVAIRFTHPPGLPAGTSISVRSAGELVETARLSAQSAPGAILVSEVPAALVGSGALDLEVRLDAPPPDGDCTPTEGITIDAAASSVRIEPAAGPLRLADIRRLLVPPAADAPSGASGDEPDVTGPRTIALDVPAAPGSDDPAFVQAAVDVAWQLGRWTASDAALPVLVPDAADADVAVAVEASADPGRMQVALAEGRPTLTLRGAGDDLERLAAVLLAPAALASVATDVLAVQDAPVEPSAAPWVDGRATLGALVAEDLVAAGSGSTLLVAPLGLPVGPQRVGSLELSLDLDVAPVVDREASRIVLLLDGTEVASGDLGAAGAGPVTLRAEPVELSTRRPVLGLRVDVALTGEACGTPSAASAQVRVLPASTVTVTTTTAVTGDPDDGGPDRLGDLPGLPAGPDTPLTLLADLDDPTLRLAAAQTALALGRAVGERADPVQVLDVDAEPADADGTEGSDGTDGAGDAGGPDLPEGDLVVVGDAARRMAGVDPGVPILAAEPGTPVGTLAVVPRPDGEGRVLVVGGEPDGTLAAARTLSDLDLLADVEGDRTGVIGDPYLVATDDTAPAVELSPLVSVDDVEDPSRPAGVLGPVAVLLVAVGLAWLRRRGR
ncbi:MAG: cellulose biosynthesis cyclic di-GMP-binding regulatory protein BcsB [Actinomycetes bacterium]